MFQTSIMNYTSRVDIARHGFQSVTLKLAQDYRRFKRDLRASRDRDLRDARAQGRQALRSRAREDPRVAQDPRADDIDAAASVGRGVRRSQGAHSLNPAAPPNRHRTSGKDSQRPVGAAATGASARPFAFSFSPERNRTGPAEPGR